MSSSLEVTWSVSDFKYNAYIEQWMMNNCFILTFFAAQRWMVLFMIGWEFIAGWEDVDRGSWVRSQDCLWTHLFLFVSSRWFKSVCFSVKNIQTSCSVTLCWLLNILVHYVTVRLHVALCYGALLNYITSALCHVALHHIVALTSHSNALTSHLKFSIWSGKIIKFIYLLLCPYHCYK